jgi:hypothetical protein
MSTPTDTPPSGRDAMDARMDAIRLKQILGTALTEHELMCLQIEQNGFGCGPCSIAGRSSDRSIRDGR